MKQDNLQDRQLYRVAYNYAPNQYEFITIGADSSNLMVYHVVRQQAKDIFAKKYANYQNGLLRVL